MAWGNKEKIIAGSVGCGVPLLCCVLGLTGTGVYAGINNFVNRDPSSTSTVTARNYRLGTPTVGSASGTPDAQSTAAGTTDPTVVTPYGKIIADYVLQPGGCVDVNAGANTVTLIQGDVKVGPDQQHLTKAYDDDQNSGLIVEATGPISVCADWGADVQVVGTNLATISGLEGQDIEGMKTNGCGLTTGCRRVDVVKATDGQLLSTQG